MSTKNKVKIVFVLLVVTILVSLGVTYAFFNYTKISTKSHSIIAGNIALTYNEETNTLSLSNAFPETKEEARARNDNFITFTISGLNTSAKDVNYEIDLIHGNDISGKTRFNDEHLKFDLEETISGTTTMVVNNMSYGDLTNYLSIWVNKVDAGTNSSITRTYKLRMWISDEVTISDTKVDADYTASNYHNLYASVKVRVTGDFAEHDYYKNATQMLITSALPSNQPSEFVTTAINFGNISSDTNGKGLYILLGTENDEYPIVYFRGAVTNNNVIFGGFCWQMVRTTDTGGIKMIYNGVVTGNGSTCENETRTNRRMGMVAFNLMNQTMSGVGYMFNAQYPYRNNEPTAGAYYGTSAEYGDFDSNGTSEYRLVSGTTSTTLDATHHYSCDLTTDTGTCTTLRYYYYNSGSQCYYINLTNGDFVEDALYKMTGNGTSEVINRNSGYLLNNTDSSIKISLETWFRNNLTNEVNTSIPNYLNYLEDTTWCNDRTYKTGSLESSGWNPNGGDLTNSISFGVANRNFNNNWYSTTNVPVTTCPKITDQFRVNNSEAQINYPIGLLTVDEVIMSGLSGNDNTSNSTYYLYTGVVGVGGASYYWLLSPSGFTRTQPNMRFVYAADYLASQTSSSNYDIRGAISLKLGTEFETGGDGTPTNPYVVKMN